MPSLSEWIANERDKILRDMSLTQVQAVRRLFALGYSVEQAWSMTSVGTNSHPQRRQHATSSGKNT